MNTFKVRTTPIEQTGRYIVRCGEVFDEEIVWDSPRYVTIVKTKNGHLKFKGENMIKFTFWDEDIFCYSRYEGSEHVFQIIEKIKN